MKTIKIQFKKDGTTKLETTGFVGSECRSASAPYEKALGVKTADDPKPELYEAPLEHGGLTA